MKLLLLLVILLVLSGCAANRVLVKNCQALEGTDQWNCELVEEL